MILFIGCVNFNAKNGCQQCTVTGEYSDIFRNMSFPNIDAARRNNNTFRTRSQPSHHKEKSLFEELDIDMIAAFPTSDPLHLLELGVMRRCLFRWVYGSKGYFRKWRKSTVERISRLLKECQTYMPSDCHRALRPLDCLRFWKGVEYRTFLLYIGMVILKEAATEEEYRHFLLISSAVRICSCDLYKSFIPIAGKMFNTYVLNYIKIYGRHTIGSNVHHLIHITEDMVRCDVGNLMDLSTYKYENALRVMGLQLKHCNLPLEQISRRIVEKTKVEKFSMKLCKYNISADSFSPQVYYKRKRQNRITYDKISIAPDVNLSNRKKGDLLFITKDGEIVKMAYIIGQNGYKICGFSLKEKDSFFLNPINSAKFDIYESNCILNEELCTFSSKSIKAKMMCLPSGDKFVFIPILHSLESLCLI